MLQLLSHKRQRLRSKGGACWGRGIQLPLRPDPEYPVTYHHEMDGTLHGNIGELDIHLLRRPHCRTGSAHIFTLPLHHMHTKLSCASNDTSKPTSFSWHFRRSLTFLCQGLIQRSWLGRWFFSDAMFVSALEFCLGKSFCLKRQHVWSYRRNPIWGIWGWGKHEHAARRIAWHWNMEDWVTSTLSWYFAWSYSRLAGLDYRNSILHLRDKMESRIE